MWIYGPIPKPTAEVEPVELPDVCVFLILCGLGIRELLYPGSLCHNLFTWVYILK